MEHYSFKPLSEEEKRALREQARERIRKWSTAEEEVPTFSILVPAYRTNPAFLKDLVISLREQAYPLWELILLDASGDDGVHAALDAICAETQVTMISEHKAGDEAGEEDDAVNVGSVRYVRLAENGGISENTNAGIPYAHGRYVGLLDHDDVLTPDALLEMAKAIRGEKEHPDGEKSMRLSAEDMPLLVYSDEDKWDGAEQYYERHRKEDFNFDLFLSNNFVCHFLVMERGLFSKLRLRKEFDGAQDYDLVLRAAAEIMACGYSPERVIRHVPKVLYHWRCHGGSTAENPQSKLYAYEAGRRALQDFADRQGWQAKAEDLKHLGFYRLCFGGAERTLEERGDLGAIGGKILTDGKISGGRMAADGGVYYEGLRAEFSGYLNRAVLTQDAEAVDLRCIHVAKEYWPLFQTIVGVPYVARTLPGKSAENGEKGAESVAAEIFDVKTLPGNADVKALSLQFCKALREQGKRILWDPQLILTTDVT